MTVLSSLSEKRKHEFVGLSTGVVGRKQHKGRRLVAADQALIHNMLSHATLLGLYSFPVGRETRAFGVKGMGFHWQVGFGWYN